MILARFTKFCMKLVMKDDVRFLKFGNMMKKSGDPVDQRVYGEESEIILNWAFSNTYRRAKVPAISLKN